jgi:hypothetical protein
MPLEVEQIFRMCGELEETVVYQQWRIDGGVGGGSNPPPMTGPTKIFSIEFNMVYSVLCVIYAVGLSLAQ